MAEKNTEENKNQKKKHKWIGIFLIAVLLLFIGLAGYYLERDLEPVPDNQVEENEIIDQGTNGSEAETDNEKEESAINGEDSEEDERITDSSDSTVDEKNNIESDSNLEFESGAETQTEAEKAEGLDAETEIEELSGEVEEEVVNESGMGEDSSQKEEDSIDDAEREGEDSALESETQDDLAEQKEDSSLIEQILSILGLSESEFKQNLNILFVGLDDEESVAIGSVEADSIMLGKLRPEDNRLEIKHIDEDTNYKGQLLRDYHNGDIQLAVEEITETQIDYYVFVKYQGFEKVIDELGGIKITLEQEVKVPGLGLDLKEGDNLLSGREALNFVRWDDSDSMARFERQKVLINSVVSKLKGNNILFNVKDLYNTIVESYNSIVTDINPVLAAEIFNYIRENDDLQLEFIN